MPLTVLFDLDDTLLQTHGAAFLPYYFKALGETFSFLAPEEKIIQQVRFAVKKMIENQDPGRILKDVFAEHFYKPLGTTENACKTLLKDFYNVEYPKLERLVSRKPAAKPLIEWCHSQNIQSAITTDPLFPAMATRHRINWAGLDPQDFVFFTTFDDFHFTKPHLAYYAEALGRLGWPEAPVVMVGDNFNHDIQPMEAFGYSRFWVDPDIHDPGQPHGPLSDVQPFLKKLLADPVPPKLNSDPSILLAILRSTPAVLDTWIRMVPEDKWHGTFTHDDLNLCDIIGSFALKERQVYLPLWQSLIESQGPQQFSSKIEDNKKTEKYHGTCDPSELFASFLVNRKHSLILLEKIFDNRLLTIVLQKTGTAERTLHDLAIDCAQHDRALLHQCYEIINI